MRKKIVAKTLLTLLLTSVLPVMNSVLKVNAQGETIYIRPDGSIDPPTAPIQRVGNVYTFTDNIYEPIVVQRNNIIVDGNEYMLQGPGNNTGFDLSNRNDVTIKKTHITGWNYSVHLYNQSSGNTIENNMIYQNEYGVLYHQSSGNTIENNNLYQMRACAIFLSNSSNNIISANNIISNNGEGIFLWQTNATMVTGNNVSINGEDGISIALYSFNNTITHNTVSSNLHAGISLPWEISTGNVITNNNIIRNVWTGIYISWATASDNTFYHNNIDNNTNQVITVEATNIWDNGYPSGGNYWSNYAGQDLDGDGVGDTPHVIDASNQDNYPLMNPYIAGDINYDGIVNASDLSVFSNAYGATPDSPNWNVRADINDDLIVGVKDLFTIGKDFGEPGP